MPTSGRFSYLRDAAPPSVPQVRLRASRSLSPMLVQPTPVFDLSDDENGPAHYSRGRRGSESRSRSLPPQIAKVPLTPAAAVESEQLPKVVSAFAQTVE